MSQSMRALVTSALVAAVYAQGVIISAKGPSGPLGLGLLVDPKKADANIINTKEITQNVVNECGRTILGGNMDIGEQTELQLINKTVTGVTKGANVEVTIAQISADGAGPYSCDLDLTSNSNGATGQTKLTVKEAQPVGGKIKLTVAMPKDLACVGASTGNVCTVRCFNANAKGPFGGCIPVQQTDITPKVNSPKNIPTAQTLSGVLAQIAQNNKDLPAAVKANQEAPTQDDQGVVAVKDLLKGATLKAAGAAANAAAVPAAGGGAATTPAAPATGNAKGGKKGANAGGGGAKKANGAAKKKANNANNKRDAQRDAADLLPSRLARRIDF